MTSGPSAPSGPPSNGGGGGSRLHLRAIREMPSGHDAELATIFREMRRAAGVSAEQMAGRLATGVDTLEALENGDLLALPEWGELNRVITTYAAQLGLDSRPILRRLEGQLDVANAQQAEPAPRQRAGQDAPPGPPMPPSASVPPKPAAPPRGNPLPRPPGSAPVQPQRPAPPPPHSAGAPPAPPLPHRRTAAPPPPRQPRAPAQTASPAPVPPPEGETPAAGGRVKRVLKTLFNWAILVGFVAALAFGVWTAAKNPRAVWSGLDSLPEPIPRAMRSLWELVRPLDDAPRRPQVSDPDNRKSDKLP